MYSTEKILGNVAWLINALDDEALAEVQNLPFLELAKAVTTIPSPTESSLVLGNRDRRHIPPWYSTTLKKGVLKT